MHCSRLDWSAFQGQSAMMRIGRRIGLAMALAVGLAGCVTDQRPSTGGPIGQPQGRWADQMHWVPIPATGELVHMRLCRPEGGREARLVLINHGGANTAARMAMRPMSCDSPAIRWFLERGHAVGLPLRRGFGLTGGDPVETRESCGETAYLNNAREGAISILAAVEYATALPGIRPDGVVVQGQSLGGWAALGVAAQNPPRVAAVINTAGGRTGGMGTGFYETCQPATMVSAAGVMGRTARVPTLWIYSENDAFFASPLVTRLHQAFVGGGGDARLEMLPPFGADGHAIFFSQGGSALWGPLVTVFLAGLPP
jgi:dienelactone hydrolase